MDQGVYGPNERFISAQALILACLIEIAHREGSKGDERPSLGKSLFV